MQIVLSDDELMSLCATGAGEWKTFVMARPQVTTGPQAFVIRHGSTAEAAASTADDEADPFRDNGTHLDYRSLCNVVKTLREDQDDLRTEYVKLWRELIALRELADAQAGRLAAQREALEELRKEVSALGEEVKLLSKRERFRRAVECATAAR
jgi:hypothetical protein